MPKLSSLKWSEHLPKWCNALLVAILGYWLASLIWWLVPLKQTQAAPAAVNASNVVQQQPVVRYGQNIANRHVFGVFEPPKDESAVTDVNQAPETNLNLVLKGVLLQQPKKGSLAMIAQGNGKQEPYAIGDAIVSGAELADLYADRAIIKYRGRYETLMLEGVIRTNINTAEPQKPKATAQRVQPTLDMNQIVPSSEAARMRSEFIRNPASLMSKVKIKQTRLPDNRTGFMINSRGDADLFYRLGLQENDVVVAVNGKSITDIPAMNQLQNAKQYDVTIVRNGVEMPVTIRFD